MEGGRYTVPLEMVVGQWITRRLLARIFGAAPEMRVGSLLVIHCVTLSSSGGVYHHFEWRNVPPPPNATQDFAQCWAKLLSATARWGIFVFIKNGTTRCGNYSPSQNGLWQNFFATTCSGHF